MPRAGGKGVAEGIVPIRAPLIFTANDCLDIGIALGSPVVLGGQRCRAASDTRWANAHGELQF
jgi:hypothetical protein